MIFLDQVSGPHRLRTMSSVGEVFPLTTTANGRACLALMPKDKAQPLIDAEIERRLAHKDVAELMEALQAIG